MKYLWRMKNHLVTGMFVFAAALLLFVVNSLEAHAYIQTQGTVVSDSAVIRKEPNANSNVIASVMKGDKVTINNEEADSNGVIWYKVFVDSETLGYVRGDLIQKDGASAPITNNTTTNTDTSTDSSSSTTTSDSSNEVNTNVTVGATTTVTPVQSQGASVTGDTVRVRAEASTNASIVTQVKKSTAITVNGQADGTDGKVWYRVSFIVDGAEVIGFIRSDFVQLTEEIVIIDENAVTEEPEQPETLEETPIVEEIVNTDFELRYEPNAEGINEWYLYNNVEGVKNKLSELMDAAEGNGDAVEEAEAQLKKQKTVIIVLAIIIVFMALGLTLLFFKVRDMYYDDFDNYDEEPERPKRNPSTPPRTVKPVQGERPAARPQGQRPANGQARPANGQARPANGQQRPANGQARPANSQQRPANGQARSANGQQRPANGQQRPANGQQRPANGQQRPANGQARPANGQQRPANGQARPANSQQRPVNSQPRPQEDVIKPSPSQNAPKSDAGWKAKNFMAEDDDFEFEFLNWDGDEK